MVIPHTTVHDAVADAVRRWPERLAVVDEDRQLTFRELWQLSGAVAARLVAGSAGEGRLEDGALVGVCTDRTVDAVVAILGVLRAGAAYVPLDLAAPAARLGLILEDARPVALVADEAGARHAPTDVPVAVSYTHLDVYKRQGHSSRSRMMSASRPGCPRRVSGLRHPSRRRCLSAPVL